MDKCPIKSPENRTRALIAFELLRAALVLAIIGWWGWLLISKTRQIVALEGSIDKTQVMRMIYWEAGTLFLLVGVSTALSLYFYLRDAARTRQLKLFFAAMAHELRTPLSSIRLQSEALARKVKSPLTERLIEDTTRLEAQIERGMELARLETGAAQRELLPVSLAETLERALGLFPESERKRLQVKGALDVQVLAEPHGLRVIFRNLLENSLHHATTTGSKKCSITFTSSPLPHGGFRITFKDSGPGFTTGKPEKLGTLFFKGKASGGTGLGLYLIRTLMREYGGQAHFHGGKGFPVTLEFVRADATA